MNQVAAVIVDTNAPEAKSRPHQGRRTWPRLLLGGLALWVATVLVTFVTQNSNLIPTIILLGSFLVPVTFVTYAFNYADPIITPQRCGHVLQGGPLHVLVPPVFRQRSASPKSSLTSIVRCRPPAHHQPALPLRPPMTLCLTRPSAPEARAQTLGTATEFTFTQSRRAG